MFKTVSEVIKSDYNTSLFLVDIGVMGFKDVLREHDDRCMNIGVFEDGMVSMMAGMALGGYIPIVYGISPFIIERAYEQLKLDFNYQMLGGNFILSGAAYDFSKYGYSHYCPADLGLVQMLPNAKFIAPGTGQEFEELFKMNYKSTVPVFYRLSDFPNENEVDVGFNRAKIIKRGSKATVIAVSTMLDKVIEACGDEDVTILYYTTLKPFDYSTLCSEYVGDRILLCEPYYYGLLTQDIVNAITPSPVRIDYVGLPRKIFRDYGTKQEKDEYYGLTVENIQDKLRGLINE